MRTHFLFHSRWIIIAFLEWFKAEFQTFYVKENNKYSIWNAYNNPFHWDDNRSMCSASKPNIHIFGIDQRFWLYKAIDNFFLFFFSILMQLCKFRYDKVYPLFPSFCFISSSFSYLLWIYCLRQNVVIMRLVEYRKCYKISLEIYCDLKMLPMSFNKSDKRQTAC